MVKDFIVKIILAIIVIVAFFVQYLTKNLLITTTLLWLYVLINQIRSFFRP